MKFVNLEQFKNAVKDYNISRGRVFKWVKMTNEGKVKCASEGCQWMIFCGFNSNKKTFWIKTFNSEHTCCKEFQNKKANTN